MASQTDLEITMPSLENSFSLQARVEDITLVEAATTPKHDNVCLFGEDFQSAFQTDVLGEKVASSSEAAHLETTERLFGEDKENQVPIELLLAQEKSPEKPQPRRKSTRLSSIYELDEIERPSKTCGVPQEREEHQQQQQPQNVLEAPAVDTQIQTVSITEPPPANPVAEHRLPVSTEETLAFAEPQAPVQAAEPQEGPSSPKRRALQSVEDASKLSMPEPQLLELDQPQPCAASSAVKARPPRRAAPSPLPPLSLEELVHPPQAPPPRRPRKRPARLLVDSVLQLSKAQLRENFELSKSLLCTRAEILALSSWETHPKRARSLNVDRLLALPANWELAISLGLGELWRSKRRMCEALPLRDSPQPPRDTSRSQSRSNLSSLRESALEASREEARAASDMLSASSFVPRQSSLNPSSFTIRASSSQDGDKSLQQQPPTPKDTVIAQQTTYSIADAPPLPPKAEQLLPVPEVLPEGTVPPPPPLSDIPASYANESAFLDTVTEQFSLGVLEIDFTRLLSPSCTRKQAAKTFHHLLCLLKSRKVRVSQAAPFETIWISPGS
uniref:Rad21_Rec8 domain-containing protein n=2 Tax=Mesocestoides corti TaxID=53468 RepID=A0A5K3F7B3_MESCO